MTKQLLTGAILSIGAAFVLAAPANATIVLTLPSYDSPNGYDFVNTFPLTGPTTIGTFTFLLPAGETVAGITISGTFGNGDSGTTALSDYYLGYSGNETAVEVATCNSIFDDCYSAQNGPTSWTYTLTGSNLKAIASALAAGSLDFTYTWDNNTQFALPGYSQYVYAGPATIDITVTPEPASVLLCFSALAGLAALRRFRKV
ncbi:MAG TPA: VPLPA-CTERM sorting domain-containing protein [Bryobacteraceae bacterium]